MVFTFQIKTFKDSVRLSRPTNTVEAYRTESNDRKEVFCYDKKSNRVFQGARDSES